MLSPPIDELEAERPSPPSPRRRGRHRGGSRWSQSTVHRRRRRVLAVVASVLALVLLWLAMSLGSALNDPSLGSSYGARAAEWFRDHGGASIVTWAENWWYSHHQPKVGGTLPKGTIHKAKSVPATAATSTVPHLPVPPPITPFASPPVAGEGQWSPVGRLVNGLPAVYTTQIRPDAIHTSYAVGVAWMDTKLLKATLYSGSQIPGGGPYPYTAPISPAASTTLVSAFNAGFLMNDANGGYYTDGKTEVPLRNGAASFVVYKDGSSTVGQWGTELTMNPNVVSVRQNLVLLVDNGQVTPTVSDANSAAWGAALGGALYVWRSALGVTANGALVYVGGPGLDISDLANIMVRAGAVRAMELDMNTDWVNYSYYTPATPNGPATPANGTTLVPNMTGGPARYFASWWARDFITMSAASLSVPASSPAR